MLLLLVLLYKKLYLVSFSSIINSLLHLYGSAHKETCQVQNKKYHKFVIKIFLLKSYTNLTSQAFLHTNTNILTKYFEG